MKVESAPWVVETSSGKYLHGRCKLFRCQKRWNSPKRKQWSEGEWEKQLLYRPINKEKIVVNVSRKNSKAIIARCLFTVSSRLREEKERKIYASLFHKRENKSELWKSAVSLCGNVLEHREDWRMRRIEGRRGIFGVFFCIIIKIKKTERRSDELST